VAGFGGLRDHDRQLTFKPQLPDAIPRLTFRVTYRGSRLKVTIEPHQATYQLLDGDPIEISHHGESLTVKRRKVRQIPPPPKLDPPTQPPGREPPLY
jgi:alpha,alpha-trehalose phosphorylase